MSFKKYLNENGIEKSKLIGMDLSNQVAVVDEIGHEIEILESQIKTLEKTRTKEQKILGALTKKFHKQAKIDNNNKR